MLVYVDGELLDSESASVSVFDHALVTGDGAFETVAVYGGEPFALQRHLDRLERTCAGMRLTPPDSSELSVQIRDLAKRNSVLDGKVRITYTAGNSGLGSGRSGGPTRTIIATEAGRRSTEPTKVCLAPWPRNERGVLAGLKTTSYAENVIALDWAKERGGSEVIFENLQGMLCEGSGSNIFVVIGGELMTPSTRTGCLAGVTRDLIVERVGAKEVEIPAALLYTDEVEEAFLSSSLREVQPIMAVDDRTFLSAPGPVTKRTATTFADILVEELRR